MEQLSMSTSSDLPPGYRHLTTLLPLLTQTSLILNGVTLFILVGNFGPARHFWSSFEIFISLAWFFFLIALSVSLLVHSVLVFQRTHVIDAFGRGRDGYRKWRDGGIGSHGLGTRLSVGLVVKVPVVFVLTIVVLMGILFCALCVVAHQIAIGWIGFVWTLLMMILAAVVWFLQEHA